MGSAFGASLNMLTDNYAAQSTEKYPTLLEASILKAYRKIQYRFDERPF
jgi:hypothetical protein